MEALKAHVKDGAHDLDDAKRAARSRAPRAGRLLLLAGFTACSSGAPDGSAASADDVREEPAGRDFSEQNVFVSELPREPGRLPGECLPRQLFDVETACLAVEVSGADDCACDPARGRRPVASELRESVLRGCEEGGDDETCGDCSCAIDALQGAALDRCRTDPEATEPPGFCYIDPQAGVGEAVLVAACPSPPRGFRYLGAAAPEPGARVFLACAL